MKQSYFFFLYALLLSCQPIDMEYANVIQSPSLNSDTNEIAKKQTRQSFSTRSFQKEFKERFLSNKLDLVFILDTSPGMESFYKKNPFGENFLNQFENYDWKLAYTDMSLDIEKISEEESESNTGSCNILSGLGMTVGGFFLGAGSPVLTTFGIKELSKCKIFNKSDSNKTNYANGDFLDFEFQGKILETNNLKQITKKTSDYNTIFNHTFSLSNNTKKSNFSAPILRKTESYPLLSLFFSIAKTLNLKDSSENNKEELGFFRKDSLVVYVLVTTQDMKTTFSAEKFIQSIESVFENKDRVKLILITLTDDSPLFCHLKLEKKSTDSEKLRKLAKKLAFPSLDICSKSLDEKIFNEISKNLDSKIL